MRQSDSLLGRVRKQVAQVVDDVRFEVERRSGAGQAHHAGRPTSLYGAGETGVPRPRHFPVRPERVGGELEQTRPLPDHAHEATAEERARQAPQVAAAPRRPVNALAASVRRDLRAPGALRKAVIAREMLDVPVGLRDDR